MAAFQLPTQQEGLTEQELNVKPPESAVSGEVVSLTDEIANQILSAPTLDEKVKLAQSAGVPDFLIEGVVGQPLINQKENDEIATKTAQAFQLSAELQSETPEPGPQETIEEPSTGRKIKFGFEKFAPDIVNLNRFITQHFPSASDRIEIVPTEEGFFQLRYVPVEERYGPDFRELTPDQRRERMNKVHAAELKEQFPDIVGTEFEDDVSVYFGGLLSTVTTPTSLIPIGQSLKAAAGIGALIGASDVTLHDLATTGEVNPLRTGVGAVGGALLAPATVKLSRVVGDIASKALFRRTTTVADRVMDRMDRQIAFETVQGRAGFEAIQTARQRLGLSVDDYNNAMRITNRRPIIPRNKQQAEELATNAIAIGHYHPQGFVSQLMEPLNSRVKKLSENVSDALRRMEFNIHTRVHNDIVASHSFFNHYNNLSRRQRDIVTRALYNGKLDIVRGVFQGNKEALEGLTSIRNKLDDLFNEWTKTGRVRLKKVDNYFPRLVKDEKGLMQAVGTKDMTAIQHIISRQQKAMDRPLNPVERSEIINRYLASNRSLEPQTSFARSRKMPQIREDFMKYYATPEESLYAYLRAAISDIEKRGFFGKSLRQHPKTGVIDYDRSVGKLVDSDPLLFNNPQAQQELKQLLKVRFVEGEKGAHKFVEGLRKLGYMGFLGHFLSAITQLGDVALAAYMNGLIRTGVAIFTPRQIKAVELGILRASQDLVASPFDAAKLLNNTLRLSGFNRVDNFGKNIFLNSSYRKFRKLARTEAGRQKIKEKYGRVFQNEMPELLDDLTNNRMSGNVKLLLWNEISDLQPISLSEMPLKYLQNPNARIFYMLKSFTIKQLDRIRQDAFAKIRKGNVFEGTRNLVHFVTLFTMANMGTDVIKAWISGRELREEDLPDIVVRNLYKNFGATEYMASKVIQGNFEDALGNELIGIPVFGIIDAVWSDSVNLMTKDPEEWKSESIRYVPIFGRFYYYWFGKGLERELKRREQASRITTEPLS